MNSNIVIPDNVRVTDQEIDISILNKKQKDFYIQLFKDLIIKYEKSGKQRFIVGVAGPSGSGKSVAGIIFKEISKQMDIPFSFETVTIDAFHYSNKLLLEKTADTGESLRKVKGRFDTYDLDKLAAALNSFSQGSTISFPVYSRVSHDTVENSIFVTEQKSLLLIEGLWLFRTQDSWAQILPLLDLKIFITANKEKSKTLTINRHIKGGKTEIEAINFYENVDELNFDLVMDTKSKADIIIPPYYEI